jgi:hypothetical protein
MKQQHDVDIVTEVWKSSPETLTLSEGERLSFARQILFWLMLVSVLVFIAHGTYPDNKAVSEIFELIKIGALPLITLVVSFYFPNSIK